MKLSIFWDITQRNPVKVNCRFGGKYALHLQGWRVSQARNNMKQVASRPSLTLRTWRWRRYVFPKCWLAFTQLHVVISQKIELFFSSYFVTHLFRCFPATKVNTRKSNRPKSKTKDPISLRTNATQILWESYSSPIRCAVRPNWQCEHSTRSAAFPKLIVSFSLCILYYKLLLNLHPVFQHYTVKISKREQRLTRCKLPWDWKNISS
jgi:hypothetical protein